MLECTMLLLLAFAYAGPVGYWAGFFNFRIVIWTVCIYHALPALDDALGKRAGSHSPKSFVDVVWQDWHRIVQPIMQLPVTWGCNLKWCEPGLYALFEGGLGRQFSDRYLLYATDYCCEYWTIFPIMTCHVILLSPQTKNSEFSSSFPYNTISTNLT
jgi:hypothetical protein